MTPTPETKPVPQDLPSPLLFDEADSLEARMASWERWAHDEQALPEAALDAALVRLLEQIRHSL